VPDQRLPRPRTQPHGMEEPGGPIGESYQ
jgi:hypothetical protein